MDDETTTKLDEMDARLLEQEHRIFPIILNRFGSAYGGRSTKCKNAIDRAFWWFVVGLFIPARPASAAFSWIAVLAIVVAVWSGCLARQQNILTQQQNQLVAQQNAMSEATAFATRVDAIQESLAALTEDQPIPDALHLEAVSWSQSLVPFPLGKYEGRPLSSERGRLLRALVNSPGDTGRTVAECDFSNALLQDERFLKQRPLLREAHLEAAMLDGAVLTSADMTEAYLKHATLRRCFLDGSILTSADLSHADLSDADLRGAKLEHAMLVGTVLSGAKLEGALVDRIDWFEHLLTLQTPPSGIERAKWRVVVGKNAEEFQIVAR